MTDEYSRDALIEFLGYLGDKGLMNRNTVVSRRAACNKILSILTPEEAADLRSINVDDVAHRFNNLEGKKYTPKSLQVYKSRLNASLDDFFRYRENPANFTTGTKSRKRDSNISQEGSFPSKILSNAEGSHSEKLSAQPLPQSSPTINVPIALRRDCVVQINGVPVDLTKAEATKISNVILAHGSPSEE